MTDWLGDLQPDATDRTHQLDSDIEHCGSPTERAVINEQVSRQDVEKQVFLYRL
jgi:hypothetical protein